MRRLVRRWIRRLAAAALVAAFAAPALAGKFEEDLAQIDRVLKEKPAGVPEQSLAACKSMRDMAVKLRQMGQPERAARRLLMCKKMLNLPE